MQSYRLPFLAVIALWLLPIQAIGAERPVLGQGNISCSLWREGRQTDSPSSASRTAWILGFISAFNQYGLQSQGADVSEGKNTDELMGWIDNYCRQHQGDDLHTASEAFIDAEFDGGRPIFRLSWPNFHVVPAVERGFSDHDPGGSVDRQRIGQKFKR